MEIHKPHAAKNWREFAVEIGTIVVGILIALGLEQVIESVHDRTIADEAREAVRAEVRENLYWVNQRSKTEPCLGQRLDEIGELLDRAERGQPLPVIGSLPVLIQGKMTDLRWEANSQAGRASLFTADEQRYFDNIYFTTDRIAEYLYKEEDSWAGLRALEGRSRLTPTAVDNFRTQLAQARYYDSRIRFATDRVHQWAALMHLTAHNPGNVDTDVSKPLREALCQPITASI
jgi:hypothetical protein